MSSPAEPVIALAGGRVVDWALHADAARILGADWARPFCFCIPAAAPLTVLEAAARPTSITDLRGRYHSKSKVKITKSTFTTGKLQ